MMIPLPLLSFSVIWYNRMFNEITNDWQLEFKQRAFGAKYIFGRTISGLFLFIFVLFNYTFYRKHCWLQWDSNWYLWSRRWTRWPLNHRHGPLVSEATALPTVPQPLTYGQSLTYTYYYHHLAIHLDRNDQYVFAIKMLSNTEYTFSLKI